MNSIGVMSVTNQPSLVTTALIFRPPSSLLVVPRVFFLQSPAHISYSTRYVDSLPSPSYHLMGHEEIYRLPCKHDPRTVHASQLKHERERECDHRHGHTSHCHKMTPDMTARAGWRRGWASGKHEGGKPLLRARLHLGRGSEIPPLASSCPYFLRTRSRPGRGHQDPTAVPLPSSSPLHHPAS